MKSNTSYRARTILTVVAGVYSLLAGGLQVCLAAPGPSAEEITEVPEPSTVRDVPWMEKRKQDQIATLDRFNVPTDFTFTDHLGQSGIRFKNRIVDDAGKTLEASHYDHGNGTAIADVDGDGLLDIYFCSQVGDNELWRNLGGGRFEKLAGSSGLALADRIGVSASFADIDNDGDPDLYATSVRIGNLLFENDGAGSFRDITEASGLGHKGHSSSADFFDYDRDGLLDLFLTNVGEYTLEEKVREVANDIMTRDYGDQTFQFYSAHKDAFSGQLKPERYEQSLLFKNMGGNRFSNVTEQVQLDDVGWSGDATPIDVNEDGWTDLYVLNMQGHDQYYENDQGKSFVRRSREVFPATPWGSMGVKVFDFDNDGRMDLYLTDMHSDMSEDIGLEREKLKSRMMWPESFLNRQGNPSIYGNAFYRNIGKGRFEEISDEIGAENYWPWGFSVGDLNADGFDDAFLASSMNYPFRYGVNTVLLNNRGEGFLDSEFILGVEPRRGGRTAAPWFELDCPGADRRNRHCRGSGVGSDRIVVWGALGSRSSVIFDLDNDGDLDIVVNDFGTEPLILISNLAQKNEIRYLKVNLVGTQSNRDGLGARVIVQAGSETYTKVQDGQSGYLSQSRYPLYFGLGDSAAADRIEVHWPSGKKQVVEGPIQGNQIVKIEEQ